MFLPQLMAKWPTSVDTSRVTRTNLRWRKRYLYTMSLER